MLREMQRVGGKGNKKMSLCDKKVNLKLIYRILNRKREKNLNLS